MSEKKNKSWPMTRDQSFIAAAVFVSFFVLWFLWAAVGNKFICWIGGKSNLSGWVQAFGSIVAIIGAALFPIIHYRYMENKKNLDQLKLDKQLMLRVKKVFIDLEKDINSCSVRYIFCLKKSEDYSDEYGFILDELPIKEINKLFEEFLLWFKPYHNLMGDPLISSSVSGVSGDISRLMSGLSPVARTIVSDGSTQSARTAT